MTEIQRLLTETIESLNTREKRDNKPRFSISFIRKHPGLFIGMYVAFFATLAVMLQSETLSRSFRVHLTAGAKLFDGAHHSV